MRVLLLESEIGAAAGTDAVLTEAGHQVLRCDTVTGAPCRGLDDGGACPLDGDGVDVAVLVHRHGALQPSEHGALCAARRRVPVVSTGYLGGGTPLGNLARPAGVDLVAACEAAARDGRRHAEAVRRDLVALGVVAASDVEPDGPCAVDVRREPKRLAMTLRLPAGDRRESAMVKAAAESLRRYDPMVPVIDVRVVH
jgi:hypothetical protein